MRTIPVENLPETFVHEGNKINKSEFLNSWEHVVQYNSRLLDEARETPPPDPAPTAARPKAHGWATN